MLALLVGLPGAALAEASGQDPAARLIAAVRGGDTQGYGKLIVQVGSVSLRDRGGNGLVALAVFARNEDILADLLRRGAPVDGIGTLGKSALGIASRNGDEAMVAQLLAAGADPSAVAKDGEPPIVDAIRSGKTQVLRLLAQSGANVSQASGELKLTPVMIAIEQGNQAALDVLLDMGPDLEKQDLHGQTALYWAIHAGHIEVVERLVGGNANMRNVRTGHSALAVAIGENQPDIAELIRRKCPDCR